MKSIRIGFLVSCSVVAANAAAITAGDVFASLSGGLVNEYTSAGAFVQTLNTGLGGFTTGSAFDSAGNFYVTDFSSSAVSKFNNNGVLQGTFGSGYSTPEDILFDGSGNVFVGNTGGGLRKFNSSGVFQSTFAASSRIDWFDLNASETIMYFTDEGGSAIHRWNMTTNTALTDLGTSDVNHHWNPRTDL
jgi:sugar lactone lactonase YvrE